MYSQIYHSTPESELKSDTPTTENVVGISKSSEPVQQVSTYSISNTNHNRKRYWNTGARDRLKIIINNEYIPLETQASEKEDHETATVVINNKIPLQLCVNKEVKKNKKRRRKKNKVKNTDVPKSIPPCSVCLKQQCQCKIPFWHSSYKFLNPFNQNKITSQNNPVHISNTKLNSSDKNESISQPIVIISDTDDDDDDVEIIPAKNDPVYIVSDTEDSELVSETNVTKTEFNTENDVKNENFVSGDISLRCKNEQDFKFNFDLKAIDDDDDVIYVIPNVRETHVDLTESVTSCESFNNSDQDHQDIQSANNKTEVGGKKIESENKIIKNNLENASFNQVKSTSDTEVISSAFEKNLINKLTEIERNELLHTPDSTINDFIEPLKESQGFNFGLHGSDIDLCEKDSVRSDPVFNDVYESESSCSAHGTPTKKSFDISSEPPKDIFQEPDLTVFSNFITPDRNKKRKSGDLGQVKTKALKLQKDKTNDRNKIITQINKMQRKKDRYMLLINEEPDNKKYHQKIRTLSNKIDKFLIKLNKTTCKSNKSTKNDFFEPPVLNITPKLNITRQIDTISNASSSNFLKTSKNSNLNHSNKIMDQKDKCNKAPSPSKSPNLNSSPASVSDSKKIDTRSRVHVSYSDDERENLDIKNKSTNVEIIKNIPENIVVYSSDEENSRDSHNIDIKDLSNEILLNVSSNSTNEKNIEKNVKKPNEKRKNFSDFWTPDMKKFYDDSWGQEDFDMNTALKAMSCK